MANGKCVLLPVLKNPPASKAPKTTAYTVRVTDQGVPFQYQIVARDSREAIITAKELLPTAHFVSIAKESQW